MLDEAAEIGDEPEGGAVRKRGLPGRTLFETRAVSAAAGAGKSSARETPQVLDPGCQRQMVW